MSSNKNPGKKKKIKTVESPTIESIHVKLKPVLGISPRAYVPAIWLLIFILIVFLFLVLPGIKKNGTYLTVRSLPSDSSVIVDGIRLGTSGDKVFVKHGSRNLVVRRAGFKDEKQKIEISGRIFASRLFPLQKQIIITLQPEDGYNHLSAGLRDFAGWAATGPEEGRYAIPPVLTHTARDLLQTGYQYTDNLPKAALPLSIDERQLSDILRSQFILSSGGAPAGMGNIVSFINNIAQESSGNADYYLSALSLVNEDHRSKWNLNETIEKKKTTAEALAADAENDYSKALSTNNFPVQIFGGIRFISIPKLTLPVGDMEAVSSGYNPRSGAIPVQASLKPFSISSVELNNSGFAAFISENPQWSVENRKELISASLADEKYLSSWNISGYQTGTARYPVTEISWYAAVAYTQWFTDRYLKGSGLTARLPREDEWEAAARLNRIAENTSELSDGIQAVDTADNGTIGVRGLAGNVREWALNPYRINENLLRPDDGTPSYQNPSDPLAAPERPVRGGAFIDGSLPYPAAIRGGLHPEITSPVIGFRLVIAASD